MRRITLLGAGLVIYLLLSWRKIDEIVASVVSLCSYSLLTLSELTSPATYWRHDIWEFWLAAVVWLGGGVYVVWKIRQHFKGQLVAQERMSGPVGFLAILAFIAVCAPFVTLFGPNKQGDLVTTRLLGPLSRGALVHTVPQDAEMVELSPLRRLYEQSNNIVLQQNISFNAASNNELMEPFATEARPMRFLFGTDDVGRDVFSRVVFGTRVSLGIGLCAAIGSLLIGVAIGFLAGYTNPLLDTLLMRLTDLMLSIPSIFLVVAVMAFLGTSITSLIILLSLTGWMGIARTVRTEVLRLREKEFILAAKLLHQSNWNILRKHILPNLKPILVVAATLQFGSAVLAEASLSFLGLGIQPPTASWGNMLWQAVSSLHSGWWLGFFPGALLAAVLIALHYAVKDGVRQA
ncbi:MAG: ABC transporter permease [Bacteroidetes bacterium]|nr:ABC transporter permease [Bacteroidota bacterium]MCW5894354.1 ABC transporter permease [Bacteroidota bacterium]